MAENELKTPKRIEKEKKELEIYNRYNELLEPGAMKTVVCAKVEAEFGICYSTVWAICKRVKARLEKEKKQ